MGRVCRHLELGGRRAFEYCNQSLTGHSGGSLDDESAERNMDSTSSDLEVPDGSKDSVRNWDMAHCCDVLANNLAAL